jgi:hypothetical protein
MPKQREPQPYEKVIDYDRLDARKRQDGFIVFIDEEQERYEVKYPATVVERRPDHCVRINGMLHHRNTLLFHPELALEGGDDYKRYDRMDLDWSSSNGGLGAWTTGGQNVRTTTTGNLCDRLWAYRIGLALGIVAS